MIGVFDSGVGGLSVLVEIRRLMPEADLTYIADRARAPYGTRSLSEISEVSLEIVSGLVSRGATTVVVACNTASAAALMTIREEFPDIDVVGMEPAIKPAAAISKARAVGVFATAATFQGELFDSVVSRYAIDTKVMTRTCPEWVTLVERGVVEGDEARQAVHPAITQMVDDGADVLVLGCTHFSFLGPLIARESGVEVIDPAPAVARRVNDIARDRDGTGTTTLLVNGDVEEFTDLVAKLTDLSGEFGVYQP